MTEDPRRAIARPADFDDQRGWRSGHRRHVDVGVELIGRCLREVGNELEHLAGLLDWPDERAAEDRRVHRVQPVFERRHDAEVAAATAQAPEEVRILLVVRLQQSTVRGDDIRGEHVVACETEMAPDAAEPAAEREPASARVRHRARGRDESERPRLAIEVAEQRCRPRRARYVRRRRRARRASVPGRS